MEQRSTAFFFWFFIFYLQFYMKIKEKVSLIISFILLLSAPLLGQPKTGLRGKVTDKETGEVLTGATVQITGSNSNFATITNVNGYFVIPNNLKKGEKIKVSFIGYKPEEISVKAGVNKISVKLSPISEQIEEVKVTVEAEGKTKAMLEQKNSVNIKNVISKDQIEQFPDMNAAETLQRIPGITLQRDKGEGKFVQLRGTPPEYTNFNINGEQIPSPEGGVRYVGLDVVSSDQIEFIEVSKVLTPDMDADAIGGSVNIITKSAKSKTPVIGASVSGGYSDLRKSDNYQGQFSFAQKTNKLGFTVNANYYLNNYGADNMEFQYMRGPFFNTNAQDDGINNYHLHYDEFQLRHYDITRKRTGLSSTLDYSFNDHSKIYVRGMFNHFSDYEVRRRVTYTLDDPVTETYYLYGGIERDLKERTKNQSISTINIGGQHKYRFLEIDYEGAYSIANEDVPDRLEIAFDNPGQAIRMKFDLSDPDWPKINFPDSNNASNADNYKEYEFDEMRREESIVTDDNITGKINIKIPYSTAYGNGFFKFGGKTRHKTKERDYRTQIYSQYKFEDVPGHTGTGPEFLLPELTDDFSDNNLLNHGYTIDHIPAPSKVRDFYEFYPQHFYLNKTDSKENTFTEDYLAHEEIYAAYAMFRHQYNRITFIGGVRYEYTYLDYEGKQSQQDRRGNFKSLSDSTASSEHIFLLPQLQVKYELNRNSNIKFAVTKTFSRPNFEDLIPYKNEERRKTKLGNGDLRFPQALNFDLLAETYGKQGSVLSGGLFYKNIVDYVYYHMGYVRKGDPRYGNFPRLRIEVPMNGRRANVYGAEIMTQFKLSFLPWILKDFGLYINYSYTHSDAYIGKREMDNEHSDVPILSPSYIKNLDTIPGEERISLPGQAEHSGNFAIFYDSKKFYCKLSATYSDGYILKLGKDSGMDEHYAPSPQLDFTTNYAINDNLKVFADAKNLINTPLKYHLSSSDRILKQEFYSWWFRVGLRLKIK